MVAHRRPGVNGFSCYLLIHTKYCDSFRDGCGDGGFFSMKKLTVLLLAVICFAAGFATASRIAIGDNGKNTDDINRGYYLIYPDTKYNWNQQVDVFVKKDIYYHGNGTMCDFAIRDENDLANDWLWMSRYEAEERGFKPCPNCYYDVVKIK
jgi:hypothetical protein